MWVAIDRKVWKKLTDLSWIANAASTGKPGPKWAIAVWFCLAVVGTGFLNWYAGLPGKGANAPISWKVVPGVRRLPGKFLLVMMIHPHCPCSRASISELSVLMSRCHDRLQTVVFFYTPKIFSQNWERTDLWTAASLIPGAIVVKDVDGEIAAELGSSTSGQVLLYDPSGRLVFSGGITAARGHAGGNAGSDAVAESVVGRSGSCRSTAVFGCPLVRRDCQTEKIGR